MLNRGLCFLVQKVKAPEHGRFGQYRMPVDSIQPI
jgi:hypothetical protein